MEGGARRGSSASFGRNGEAAADGQEVVESLNRSRELNGQSLESAGGGEWEEVKGELSVLPSFGPMASGLLWLEAQSLRILSLVVRWVVLNVV